MTEDICKRLRCWAHDVNAAPATDIMEEAARELERLRLTREEEEALIWFTGGNGPVCPRYLAIVQRLRQRLSEQGWEQCCAAPNDPPQVAAAPAGSVIDEHDRSDVLRRNEGESATSGPAQRKADPVNHPPHYAAIPAQCECGRRIECIQVAEWLPANLANVVKYVWRQGFKVGDGQAAREAAIIDIRKAIWYATREVARLESVSE